jgi:hypothetical protein
MKLPGVHGPFIMPLHKLWVGQLLINQLIYTTRRLEKVLSMKPTMQGLVAKGIAFCEPKVFQHYLATAACKRRQHRNLLNQTFLTCAKPVHILDIHCR